MCTYIHVSLFLEICVCLRDGLHYVVCECVCTSMYLEGKAVCLCEGICISVWRDVCVCVCQLL